MRSFSRFAILALSAAVPLVVPSVGEADQLNHSATFCRQVGSSGTFGWYNQGSVTNTHLSEKMSVYCPVVRHGGTDYTGTPKVHAIDKNQDDGVECSFYDVRAYGHDWQWQEWQESLGSGFENFRTFSFDNSASEEKYEGSHHFYCKIPARDLTYGYSTIASYNSGDW